MINYRLIKLILIVLLITACAENKEQVASCNDETVKAKLNDWLTGIRDYQIKANIEVEGQQFHSTIGGRVPDRLSIRLEPESESKAKQDVWLTKFDGDYQWVELRSGDNVQVFKIQLKPIINPQRPFDTSYYIMGSGLMNGEDFPTSMQSLLSTYDLSARCSQNSITLAGAVNGEKFKNYAKTRRKPQSDEMIEKFISQLGFLVLTLDAKSYEITGYRMGGVKEGTPKEAADKSSLFNVKFLEIKTNEDGKPDRFKYEPPTGIVPADITDQVKENFKNT